MSTNVCLVHASSSGSGAERTNLLCRALGTLSSGVPQGRPPIQPSNKNACSSYCACVAKTVRPQFGDGQP